MIGQDCETSSSLLIESSPRRQMDRTHFATGPPLFWDRCRIHMASCRGWPPFVPQRSGVRTAADSGSKWI